MQNGPRRHYSPEWHLLYTDRGSHDVKHSRMDQLPALVLHRLQGVSYRNAGESAKLVHAVLTVSSARHLVWSGNT